MLTRDQILIQLVKYQPNFRLN